MFPDIKISKTFSQEQLRYLQKIHSACMELGATAKHLAPLGGLAFVDWNYEITEKDIERAKEIERKMDAPRLFVDVDDTLVIYEEDGNDAHPYGVYLGQPWHANKRLIQGIKNFREENPEALIVIWSGGGKQYAQEWAEQLDLIQYDIVTMDKGFRNIEEMVRPGTDIVVDDMELVGKLTFKPWEWPGEKNV